LGVKWSGDVITSSSRSGK